MPDLLKRFAAYYRPHHRLFQLNFSSAILAGPIALAILGLS